MNSTCSGFKCTHPDCQYGPTGKKSFKKGVFLQNHLKNIHEMKAFKCSDCDERFAFEWQLKYHRKFCGAELRCPTCNKAYTKPMSLLMHCKRTLHSLPSDQHFKLRKNNEAKTTYVFVPIFIDSSVSALQNHKTILPKPPELNSNASRAVNLNFNERPISKLTKSGTRKSASTSKSMHAANRRSTDCQTVRKKNCTQVNSPEVKSIETQTMHSSFEPHLSRLQQNDEGAMNAKCSSFTQTFFDDIEQGDLIVRDTFLSTEMGQLEQSAQTEFGASMDVFENYNTTETQTNSSMADFGSEDIGIVTEMGSNNFKFHDLGLIDIETQTIWNYDRTTQTDHDPASLDPDWLMNI